MHASLCFHSIVLCGNSISSLGCSEWLCSLWLCCTLQPGASPAGSVSPISLYRPWPRGSQPAMPCARSPLPRIICLAAAKLIHLPPRLNCKKKVINLAGFQSSSSKVLLMKRKTAEHPSLLPKSASPSWTLGVIDTSLLFRFIKIPHKATVKETHGCQGGKDLVAAQMFTPTSKEVPVLLSVLILLRSGERQKKKKKGKEKRNVQNSCQKVSKQLHMRCSPSPSTEPV